MDSMDGASGCGLGDAPVMTYGEPYLGLGFNPFKVIAAPFKAAGKGLKAGAKFVGRTASRAPRIARAFATGGPFAAVGTALAPSRRAPRAPETGYYTTLSQPTPVAVSNPFGRSAAPYGPSYQVPGPIAPTAPNLSAANLIQQLRDSLLGAGARAVAETPAGQAAIRQKVTGDISRIAFPVTLGVLGVVTLVMLTRRR